jgi:acetyl esterase/lipase
MKLLQYIIAFGLIAFGTVVLLLVAAFTPVVLLILNYGNRNPDRQSVHPFSSDRDSVSLDDVRMDADKEAARWKGLATLTILFLTLPAFAEIKLPSGAFMELTESPAMLIIPGGGYEACQLSEGTSDLQWLTTNGVKCFTLAYNIGKPYPAAINDALAAWEMLNTNRALGIDLARVGILGVSAGGHLAALVTARTKFKPALGVFISPLVTMSTPGLYNPRCLTNMAGGKPVTSQMMEETSAERFLNASNMPPSFVAHNANDPVVPAQNSLMLWNVKQPCELHLFRSEPAEHGMSNPPPWLDNCIRFLKVQKFIR